MAPPLAGCLGCQARDAELAYLRKQNAEMVDKMVALVNPSALLALRGQQSPANPGITTDATGKQWVEHDGKQVPLEEYQRVQDKISEMFSGGRG